MELIYAKNNFNGSTALLYFNNKYIGMAYKFGFQIYGLVSKNKIKNWIFNFQSDDNIYEELKKEGFLNVEGKLMMVNPFLIQDRFFAYRAKFLNEERGNFRFILENDNKRKCFGEFKNIGKLK